MSKLSGVTFVTGLLQSVSSQPGHYMAIHILLGDLIFILTHVILHMFGLQLSRLLMLQSVIRLDFNLSYVRTLIHLFQGIAC